MDDKQLIRHLKELAEIRPRKDWVLLTKNRILAESAFVPLSGTSPDKPGLLSFFPFFRYKLAFAPIISVFIIIGLFGFAQKTVPGDTFFSVKKMAETAQVTFSSDIEKPKTQLKLANKRLEELNRIAETNQVRSLPPAIKEFQLSLVQAVKDLAEMDFNVTSSDPMIMKEIVAETQKLEENKQKIEAVLGTTIGDTEELGNALSRLEKQTAVYLLADLSQRTLSEQDQTLLAQARQDFEAGNYAGALEKIWLLSNK